MKDPEAGKRSSTGKSRLTRGHCKLILEREEGKREREKVSSKNGVEERSYAGLDTSVREKRGSRTNEGPRRDCKRLTVVFDWATNTKRRRRYIREIR